MLGGDGCWSGGILKGTTLHEKFDVRLGDAAIVASALNQIDVNAIVLGELAHWRR